MRNSILHISLTILIIVSFIVSLIAIYVKIYFWGGMMYSPVHVKIATWFVILSAPASLYLRKFSYILASGLVILQISIIVYASIN